MVDTLPARDPGAKQTSAALFLTFIVDTPDGRSTTHKLFIEADAVDDVWTWTTWRMAPRGRLPIATTRGDGPEDDLLTRFLWLIGRLDKSPQVTATPPRAARPS